MIKENGNRNWEEQTETGSRANGDLVLKDISVRIWNVATGHETGALAADVDWLRVLVFRPDGKRISLGLYVGLDAKPLQGEFELEPCKNAINHIAFSQDGTLLATSAFGEKAAQVWDISSEPAVELMTMRKHTRSVNCVAISPNGKTFASGSDDGTVRLWGQVMEKGEWERLKQERERWAHKAQQHREQVWRESGRCEVCGAKLGILDKLGRHTRCKQHR